MSVPAHALLALVDASKNDLKVSLTNYIEVQVEKTFGQLRNRIVHMIEDGESVSNLGNVNAAVPTQPNEHLSTNQNVSPPAPLTNQTATKPLIKQECLEDTSTTIPINFNYNFAPGDIYTDHLGDISMSSLIQGQVSRDEFAREDFDDDGGDQLSPRGQRNNVHSIVPSTIYHANYQLTADQITLPPAATVKQAETLTKQSNNNLTNHWDEDEDCDCEDCLNETQEKEKDEDYESAQQIKAQSNLKNSESFESVQAVIALNQQRPNSSTSGLRSSSRKPIPRKMFDHDHSIAKVKGDKRKSKTNTSIYFKAVKKVKLEKVERQIDHQEEEDEVKLQIVTLQLNCTEPRCNAVLSNLSLWKQHLSTVHGQSAYKQLKDNVRQNNLGQKEYPCNECSLVFSKSQDSVNLHWQKCHQLGQFECSACAFVANYRHEVHNHQRKHRRSNKFPCPHEGCDKAFKFAKHLENHQRIHSSDARPFVCGWDNCQSTFTRFEIAIRHVQMKHFHLPSSVEVQNEQNIIDERDPKVYVRMSREADV